MLYSGTHFEALLPLPVCWPPSTPNYKEQDHPGRGNTLIISVNYRLHTYNIPFFFFLPLITLLFSASLWCRLPAPVAIIVRLLLDVLCLVSFLACFHLVVADRFLFSLFFFCFFNRSRHILHCIEIYTPFILKSLSILILSVEANLFVCDRSCIPTTQHSIERKRKELAEFKEEPTFPIGLAVPTYNLFKILNSIPLESCRLLRRRVSKKTFTGSLI